MFERHKRFLESRQSAEDELPVRPRTSNTDKNIEKVRVVIRKDRRLGVRATAEIVNVDRESVRRILTEKLNIKNVCAKIVPKILSAEQKRSSKGNLF